jgi:hypothetical protein
MRAVRNSEIQIVHDLFDPDIDWPAITPGVSRPIIGADTSDACNGWLYQRPLDGEAASAVFYDHSRRS